MRKFLVFLFPVFFSTFFLFSNEVSAAEVLPVKIGKSIYGYSYDLSDHPNLLERDWTANKIAIPKNVNSPHPQSGNLYAVWFYPNVKKEYFQTVKFNGIDVSFYAKNDFPRMLLHNSQETICNSIGVQGFSGSWNKKVENCVAYDAPVSDGRVVHINFDLTISSTNNQSFSLGDNFNIYLGDSNSINSRQSIVSYTNCTGNSGICTNSSILYDVTINDVVLRGIDYYASATDALNQQILNQEKEQTNAINNQTKQQKEQYDRDKAEQQNRESQGKDSSNQLKGLFNIQAINPFSAIFNLFQPQNSCVQIPIIASWLRISNSQICPWFPATVRNTLTPVFGVSSIMVLFGFVVRWLRKDEA